MPIVPFIPIIEGIIRIASYYIIESIVVIVLDNPITPFEVVVLVFLKGLD